MALIGQNGPFGDQNIVFWLVLHFLETSTKICFTIMTRRHVARWASSWALWAIFRLKICIFYVTPIKPPFFGVRWIRPNGILSLPYPEVTLDNFSFPVGGRSAARRAVFRPPGRILARKSVFFAIGPRISSMASL